jgi:hypothetical protein
MSTAAARKSRKQQDRHQSYIHPQSILGDPFTENHLKSEMNDADGEFQKIRV